MKNATKTKRTVVRGFRIPEDLHIWLQGEAEENHRTAAGELIDILERVRLNKVNKGLFAECEKRGRK